MFSMPGYGSTIQMVCLRTGTQRYPAHNQNRFVEKGQGKLALSVCPVLFNDILCKYLIKLS
jgi:hypothetical protein